ncbi:kinase-like domain-containing protein [Fimicolochytrium jonesii]|uniref:kinase-like domain-containing protein n=1 Tax=Fimicolochytrium jonesii TaxID=1396493 RepID=UPI0022FF1603|nr:kinase-like domain-containing protein [Fimicolochytrium jonesii]KAI8825061.1 kinase-like domain-containing protein [Fimicolochytrium jonesii]
MVSTHNLPPPCPPPNRPLPPRPVAIPSPSHSHPSSHSYSQHHHGNGHQPHGAGHLKRHAQPGQPLRAQQNNAYPSPEGIPNVQPASMAARYLTRHQIHPVFAERYTLGQELGSGGFGFVCSAVSHNDKREVACKFILKSKVPAQGWARDSELGVVPMEVFMLKNIGHDNIIKFIDFYEDITFFYLVTEMHGAPWTSSRTELQTQSLPSQLLSSPSTQSASHIPSPNTPGMGAQFFTQQEETRQGPGGLVSSSKSPASPPLSPVMAPKLSRRPSMDLFECIEQHDRLTEPQARFVFRQIISAVQYLHTLGVVHRDIKDENILVNENFHVKLIDFGSAAFIPPPAGKLFDRFLGTIQYASPEILRGEKYRGPEAEIWALGCCLYIMLNGEVPFTTPAQAAEHAYTFPKHRLSPSCIDLLDSMLAKKSSRRATVNEVASHPWLQD